MRLCSSDAALDELLVTGPADDGAEGESAESRRSILDELKADAGATSLDSVITEIAKLERLRNLALPDELFADVSLKVLGRFRQRAAAEAPSELQAHSPALRATLVERTFAWLCQSRRFSRDYERLCSTSEALIYAAMGRLMVRRLART